MQAETTQEDLEAVAELIAQRQLLLDAIGRVIVGQHRVIDEMLISIFSRGHCLIVGVPGLAKTLLVRTVAQLLDLKFKRIQFTPDLMPADIIGTEVIQENVSTGERQMRFIPGPIFANVILADEINRTPPKTQAALLEAMQERRVTAGGTTYSLDLPFFVLATQNPIEQEGTYPLPEAQLDRFMFNIYIDYPSEEEERLIVKSTTSVDQLPEQSIMGGAQILRIQEIVRKVPVSDHVIHYAVSLARATRPRDERSPDSIKRWVSWGAGPRAAQYLVLGAKARAVCQGRLNVSCGDIREAAAPVLRHRIVPNFDAEAEGVTTDDIINELVATLPEISEEDYR